MNCRALAFHQLPHQPKLFLAYLEKFEKVKAFYAYPPTMQAVTRASKKLDYPQERRAEVAAILSKQNETLGTGTETTSNLERLAKGAVAVVSGQQVGLFGGPAYAIYNRDGNHFQPRAAGEGSRRGCLRTASRAVWRSSLRHLQGIDGDSDCRRIDTGRDRRGAGFLDGYRRSRFGGSSPHELVRSGEANPVRVARWKRSGMAGWADSARRGRRALRARGCGATRKRRR